MCFLVSHFKYEAALLQENCRRWVTIKYYRTLCTSYFVTVKFTNIIKVSSTSIRFQLNCICRVTLNSFNLRFFWEGEKEGPVFWCSVGENVSYLIVDVLLWTLNWIAVPHKRKLRKSVCFLPIIVLRKKEGQWVHLPDQRSGEHSQSNLSWMRVVIFSRDDDAFQLHAACKTGRDDTFIFTAIFDKRDASGHKIERCERQQAVTWRRMVV